MKIDYLTDYNKGVTYAILTTSTLERKRFEKIGVTIPNTFQRLVKRDKDGREYFDLPNLRSPKENQNFSFTFRIRDAVAEIKNGNGDAIIYTKVIGDENTQIHHHVINVVHYLDRSYGLSQRAKTLDEVRDYKFDYTIVVYNPNQIGNHYYLTEKMDLYFLPPNTDVLPVKYMHLPTYLKAVKKINQLEAMSMDLADWAYLNDIDLEYDFDEYEEQLDKYPSSITNVIRGGYLVNYDALNEIRNNEDEDIEQYYVARIAQDISKE